MVADINIAEIVKNELIGYRSYSRVYSGVWKTKVVALKVAVKEYQSFISEHEQLSRVAHPNIIQIYGKCFGPEEICLVMEFADCGSLHGTLHGKETVYQYTYAQSLSWARQCAEGIAYLHGMRPRPIIHCDIKPAKLLLFNERTTLKIGDFGTVRDGGMTIGRGSAPWMAPEVSERAEYNEKCDVYSWAIVLWEILARDQPFKEYDNNYAIIFNVHKGQRPPLNRMIIEQPVESLMVRCWDHDPEHRPAIGSVVNEMRDLCGGFPGE